MDIMDISNIDVNELGVRPSNWIDDENEIDFDEISNSYFGKEELSELQLLNSGHKSAINAENISMSDEDDSNYETDPETGEKTFRRVVVASSPVIAPSNERWIEQYLINIESSAVNQLIPSTTATTTFDNLLLNNEQTDSNWLAKYISPNESTTNIMFPDQFLANPYFNDQEKILPQSTSPILIPSSYQSNPDSLLNLLSVSIDDEQSISNSGSSNQRQRLFSSFESDSTTYDSELTYDESFVKTKLEKIEYDEHMIPHMLIRRSSTRTNYQGQQDEKTLHEYNIPLTLYDITQSTTEEYNRHLGRLNYLSPEQIHIIKDIRRRGKNKIAAQNCRKRKASSVEILLDEVDELKRMKHELEGRKKSYQQQIAETRHLYEYLHQQVLPDRQLPPAIIVK